ncbi:hypothetical protein [Rhodanobacter caeni]|uniref:DNA transfer protein n=1 Tax=Rhodanobacter caeni TaxID=657654 RepID=A0ABN0UT70_9GAMM
MPKLSEVAAQPQTLKLSQVQGQQAAPAQPDGGSAFDRFMIGVGHGMTRVGQAAEQLSRHIVPTSPQLDAFTGNESTPAFESRIADEEGLYQGGVGKTGAAKWGSFMGNLAATAPLGAMAVPARGATLGVAAIRGALAGGATAATSDPTQGGDDFAGQKALQFGLGAAAGGAIPVVGRGVMRAAENLVPANIVQRISNAFTNKANAQPFAQESEQLAQRTGIPFTPGQVSGAKMQTGLENLSRQSFFSADKAFEADKRTAEAAADYIRRTMDKLSPNEVSSEGVGQRVQDTVRNVVKSISDNRAATAARQYGAIDKALGGTPVVRYTNTANTINSILGEYADVPGQAAAGIRAQLQSMLDDIAKKPAYSISSAQKARSAYGRAASGSADIFKDVKTSEQARIAKRLYGAMTDDIESGAAALDGGVRFGPGLMTQADGSMIERGGIADMWRKANENYRNYSQLLDATEASPLRRLVGDKVDVGDFMTVNKLPPEKVISTLGGMAPSELKMVGNVMQRQAPNVWQDYKRLLVQNALDEAQSAPASMGANTLPLNAAKFVSAMGGGKPAKVAQLRALFTPKEYAQIDDAFNAMRRLGDKFGANYSGTAPASEMLNLLRGFGVKTAASVGSQVIGLRKMANVMLNADGRRAIVELSRLPPQSRQAASLAGYLAALATSNQSVNVGASGQIQENDRNDGAKGY